MDVLRLFDEHHALLFRFAYRLTGSVADAEDVVQECFLELMKPGCSYDPLRAPARPWLIGVARNQSLKRFREKNRPELFLDNAMEPSPEQQALRFEIEDIVQSAVLRLPEAQREVLILAHYEQMALAEIAEGLQLEVGAVKSRLQRARESLREMLAEYAPSVTREP